ncbi:MAG: hypothetical protein MPN21_26660 [Thermoanaerobaculia bacterium]|nr:hypothetical protein [Thermoanaerobaculia bacterium]
MKSQGPSGSPLHHTTRGILALSFAVGLLLTGCPKNTETAEESEPLPEAQRGSFSEKEAETSERPERSLDPTSLKNMSELLAGIVPANDPTVQDGEEVPALDPVWQEHARVMDEIWQGIEPRHELMSGWSEETLAELPDPDATLLYPFGGPDLVTALSFFPDARSYLLVGLEAPGRLPLPEKFSGTALADDLAKLRGAFGSMAQSGYFVRTQIDRGVTDGAFDGVLPILLICLVRGDQVPVAVEYVSFDRDTQELRSLPSEQTKASAVRVLFRSRSGEQGATRSVYYFAQDLSNRGLHADDPFAELLRRQESLNVYMKAAEYLLHTSDFLQFRKILLSESQLILQDDSGVPIRHFTSNRWQLRFYGSYTDVLAAYKPFYQEDLAAAFAKQTTPLPFRIGYGASGDGGGMILATRNGEASSTPGSPPER